MKGYTKYLAGGALLATTALVTHAFPIVAEHLRHFAAASGLGLMGFAPLFGTTSAANTPRTFETGDYESVPVADNVKIYEGSAVGDNGSGYAQALAAGNPFRGFCAEFVDNTSSGPLGANHTAGGLYVQVRRKGRVQLTVTGVSAVTDVGKPVYASDDMTFTLTKGSNSYIGRIVRWVISTTCIVEFDIARGGLAALQTMTTLFGPTGGAVSTTTTGQGTVLGTVNPTDTGTEVARLGQMMTNVVGFINELKLNLEKV